MPLHPQSGFVVGAVGGGDGRGSEVDYHKMKHKLKRPDTSPLGTRDWLKKEGNNKNPKCHYCLTMQGVASILLSRW